MVMIKETIDINNDAFTIKIFYEKRANVRASIRKKTIIIRIPQHLSIKEKHHQLESMKHWAIKTIRLNPEKFQQQLQKTYFNNEKIRIGNQYYTLKIQLKNKKTSSAKIKENTIYLDISDTLSKEQQNNHISHLLSRCIADKKLPELQQKIHHLNQQYFNLPVNRICFKHNKTNWGSCSQKGNINISTRLLFAPDDVFDYVCIHELAHLLEPNHSKKFWKHIENIMPDYKQKKTWLKENGKICRF
ncbi:MAG: SprT family zinc-dependent metalloprotease [Thermoplasmatota archaeon]